MKQIITQHGWGLDQSFWNNYKIEFQKNNWYWQDNERGYFSKKVNQSKWINNNSKKKIKMILCHSFGSHLIEKTLLKDVTHFVLINSFNNFLPQGDKRNLILRSLKRMERKIIKCETKDMLKEFIHKSFMPNLIDIDFQKIFYQSLENYNELLLLEDLKKLSNDINFTESLNKKCKIIFIKSEKDLILDENSCINFFKLLSKITEEEATLIKLPQQGHCLSSFNLYKILKNILDN